MWPFSSAVQETRAAPEDQTLARDILAGDSEQRKKRRWTRLLIVYLRCLALLCLARGLSDWAQIVGFTGEEDQFLQMSLGDQASLVLLAVLSCIAGVGLWLTSAWGAVLWLIVTLCEVFFPLTTGRGVRVPGVTEYVLLGLAAVYILLTWLSARERER
jgi:fatty acid desaturase